MSEADGAMPLSVVVYTDYKSPYAYVADSAIRSLAHEYPVELIWRPYTLRIADYLDPVESRSVRNWRKVKYAYMDARRMANRQGLILKGPRRIYQGDLCSIGMLFAQREGCFEAYHQSTFERFWRHDLDIDSMDEMKAHLAALGADPAAFEAWCAGEGRDEHAAIIEQADKLGVFGVPTLIFEDELFWGGDRIGLLRQAIEQRLIARSVALRGAR